MFDLAILFPSILNGITTGAVYALIALGLTLIYGVLHIINFAHGALLMVALYAVYLLKALWLPAALLTAAMVYALPSLFEATSVIIEIEEDADPQQALAAVGALFSPLLIVLAASTLFNPPRRAMLDQRHMGEHLGIGAFVAIGDLDDAVQRHHPPVEGRVEDLDVLEGRALIGKEGLVKVDGLIIADIKGFEKSRGHKGPPGNARWAGSARTDGERRRPCRPGRYQLMLNRRPARS